jgi:hypothetical protein
MHIQLPKYLDDFIFDELGGKYQTRLNVDINLNNSGHMNQIYLGTYFPRSYSESKHVFNIYFSLPNIKSLYTEKNEINIVDIGTGTGGNVVGLLESIMQNFGNNKTINIITLEGNDNAISYQIKIIDKFKEQNKFSGLNIFTKKIVLGTVINFKKEISEIIESIGINKFDIITTSKCLSEFYNKNYVDSIGLYSEYLNLSSKLLNETGLSIIIDITTMDRNNIRPYTPFIINEEVKLFLETNKNIAQIYPVSCALWNQKCQNISNCFKQRIYLISHKYKVEDSSKVCIYGFVPVPFSKTIIDNYDEKKGYVVSMKKENGNVIIYKGCIRGKLVSANQKVNY